MCAYTKLPNEIITPYRIDMQGTQGLNLRK